jgi:hypothetical protein
VPRRSSVIDHPRRARIDELLEAGDRSVAAIARDLGVGVESLKRYARKHRDHHEPAPRTLAGTTPLETFERAFGVTPKPHQTDYMSDPRPTIVIKGRQVGMTTAAAGLAVHTALVQPGSTTVIISPSLRQSGEVTDRARLAFWEWNAKLKQDSASLLRTAAGSRIISLPGSARGIRGYACALVIIDEAAFVDDDTWNAARPLVAATGGRLIVQSTPGLALGWFHELVTDPPPDWAVLRVTSEEAGTIDPAFLEAERATMAPELFAQEYGAEFGSATLGTPLFSPERIDSLFIDEVPPWQSTSAT